MEIKNKCFTIVACYVIGITIIGIIDTLCDGVAKREVAQEIRSERLAKNQAELEKKVEERQQKTEEDMRRRQAYQ